MRRRCRNAGGAVTYEVGCPIVVCQAAVAVQYREVHRETCQQFQIGGFGMVQQQQQHDGSSSWWQRAWRRKLRGSWRRAGCECFDVNKRCFGYEPLNFRSGLLRFAMHEQGG